MTASTASTDMRMRSVRCIHPGGLHRMAYTEWGERDNPRVVVCVHGLTRNGRDFDRLAAALAPQFRVVCPDIVGRGRSDWLPMYQGYQFPQYVADCVTLLARLDVDEVAWVGSSMGGLIGMMIAAMADSPIQRLVVNDVGPEVARDGLARIASYAGLATDFEDFEQAVDYIAKVSASFGPHSRDEWRELTRHVVVQKDGRWLLHYDPGIGQATRDAMAQTVTPDLWPLWQAVKAPTLVLRGAESDILTVETAQRMVTERPGTTLVEFPGVGHAPSLLPAGQIDTIQAFLKHWKEQGQ